PAPTTITRGLLGASISAPHPALRRACRPMRRGGGGTYVPRERLYKLARRADVPGRRCGERPPGGAATAGRTAATVGRTTVATAGADDGDGARGTPWRAADVD